jgi:uncharacterized coiled-coil DUF342 family protein
MAVATPRLEDSDTLENLEERILRAVELVGSLRQEKLAAEKVATELKAENTRLLEELDALRSERKQVRNRIEKLLGQLDTLAG